MVLVAVSGGGSDAVDGGRAVGSGGALVFIILFTIFFLTIVPSADASCDGICNACCNDTGNTDNGKRELCSHYYC